MPIGYLITAIVVAVCTLFALAPPRPRRSSPSNKSYWLGFLVNELPFLACYVLLASTLLAIAQGEIDSPAGWIAFGITVQAMLGLAIVVRRALAAGPAVARGLNQGLGVGWRMGLDAGIASGLQRRRPAARILLAPFLFRRGDVTRVVDVAYGDAGAENLLDVYHHRGLVSGGPTLIYLHGGAFRSGTKSREARPLIYRLASEGWVCISANYRLSPAARFPAHLVDVKKVIGWAREHVHEYGGDPAVLFVAGSSAGGHLASLAALTPNEPVFQPGFEQVDTSVTAAISLYGYYGSLIGEHEPSSPTAYVRADAPPFFVAHGDRDTVVRVEDARDFVAQLRRRSSRPVVYVELPGAQHTFDLFHSIRFETVIDGIEAFAAWVRSRRLP